MFEKYIVLMVLALIALTCATLAGLIELPTVFVQLNGLFPSAL